MAVVRAGSAADMPTIRALLETAGLPVSDLSTAQPQFVVACEGSRIVAGGALQSFGAAALLRSVAVVPERRGGGLGRLIVTELERQASEMGVGRLILLTQTAEVFFARQGYQVIDRSDAPPAIKASEEFRTLCPASATCMAKAVAKRG